MKPRAPIFVDLLDLVLVVVFGLAAVAVWYWAGSP